MSFNQVRIMKSYDDFESKVRIGSSRGKSLNGTTMAVESFVSFASDAMPMRRVSSPQAPSTQTVAKMKARQSAKIREIASALVSAGFDTLDGQARILGIGRSTAWTVLKGDHKGSGLSAKIISRTLSVRNLPPAVRKIILEYVEEKSSGAYGHSHRLRRRFIVALSARRVEEKKKPRIATMTTRTERVTANVITTPSEERSDERNTDPADPDHKTPQSRRAGAV